MLFYTCMLTSTWSTYLLFVRFTLYPRHRLHTRYMKYNTYTCICAKTDLQLVYTELSEHMVLACTRSDCNVYKDAVLCSCCTLQLLYSVSASASLSQLSRHCTCMEKHTELMCAVLLKTIGSVYAHCIELTNDQQTWKKYMIAGRCVRQRLSAHMHARRL